MKTGIYFNGRTNEIMSITDEKISVGSDWRFLTSQATLGLLAVRGVLVEQGLVCDEKAVYWHFPQPVEATLALLRCQAPSKRQAGFGWLRRKPASFSG